MIVISSHYNRGNDILLLRDVYGQLFVLSSSEWLKLTDLRPSRSAAWKFE